MSDPGRYHFIELDSDPDLREFISVAVHDVWLERERPGAGGYLLCLGTVAAWHRRLEEAGISVLQLGFGFDAFTGTEGGGYLLRSGEVLGHHYLAIGDKLTLFDPTAGQPAIAADGPVRLEAYLVHDGQRFVDWRAGRQI